MEDASGKFHMLTILDELAQVGEPCRKTQPRSSTHTLCKLFQHLVIYYRACLPRDVQHGTTEHAQDIHTHTHTGVYSGGPTWDYRACPGYSHTHTQVSTPGVQHGTTEHAQDTHTHTHKCLPRGSNMGLQSMPRILTHTHTSVYPGGPTWDYRACSGYSHTHTHKCLPWGSNMRLQSMLRIAGKGRIHTEKKTQKVLLEPVVVRNLFGQEILI